MDGPVPNRYRHKEMVSGVEDGPVEVDVDFGFVVVRFPSP